MSFPFVLLKIRRNSLSVFYGKTIATFASLSVASLRMPGGQDPQTAVATVTGVLSRGACWQACLQCGNRTFSFNPPARCISKFGLLKLLQHRI
jgi:hypothetical protein